ncbi:MAG: hypothetical protein V3V74_06915 [Nitrosomonadaceae bacterium]
MEISATKYLVSATWDDVPHLDDEQKARMLRETRPHLRDARSRGIPSLGVGAIYPIEISEIVCDPFKIPDYWPRAYAMDVGWKRTAALWGAQDPDTGVVYMYAEYYRGQAEPSVHAAAIRERGEWIPGVIDPAARGRAQKDGAILMDDYRDLGLETTPAINAVAAGIDRVYEWLSTGQLKIFSTLQNTLTEYRMYERDENQKIVKVNDHLMDCLRYWAMSGIAVARCVPYEDREEVTYRNRSAVGGY